MPELTTLALFMAAALAVNLTPGPDILYIAARSTSEGRASGVLSVVGITIGCLLHTVAAAVGLSALIAAIPAAYDAVRLAGAAYLLYLGARALVAGSSADSVAPPDRARLRTVFAQGVLTNISNPKVALFFMAFLHSLWTRAAATLACKWSSSVCCFPFPAAWSTWASP